VCRVGCQSRALDSSVPAVAFLVGAAARLTAQPLQPSVAPFLACDSAFLRSGGTSLSSSVKVATLARRSSALALLTLQLERRCCDTVRQNALLPLRVRSLTPAAGAIVTVATLANMSAALALQMLQLERRCQEHRSFLTPSPAPLLALHLDAHFFTAPMLCTIRLPCASLFKFSASSVLHHRLFNFSASSALPHRRFSCSATTSSHLPRSRSANQ
jgi:hypothetical protein